MDFGLNEEQLLLREAVERFAAEHCDPAQRAAHRATPRGYSLENWAALAEIGLLSLPFSADDGGLNGGPVQLITVMEVLGGALAVEPVLEEIVSAGGLLLSRAGTAAQKARWLPEVMGHAHKRLLWLATLFGDADHELARYIHLVDATQQGKER